MLIPRYAKLKSARGVDIDVSYTIRRDEQNGVPVWLAEEINFLVRAPIAILSPTSEVTLVLVSRRITNGVDLQGVDSWSLPLRHEFTDQGFVGFSQWFEWTIKAREHVQFLQVDSYPQIAVIADYQWELDPIQYNPAVPSWQPHNFNFAWMLDPA